MKPLVKYVLCPGRIESMRDDRVHYIDAVSLARLYGVDMRECIVYTGPLDRRHDGLIPLRPRWDGDYRLPAAAARKEPPQ